MEKYQTLICPQADSCPVYRNWSRETGNNRLNIIMENHRGYDCLALKATQDPVGGERVLLSGDLAERLPTTTMNCDCSVVEVLNLVHRKINAGVPVLDSIKKIKKSDDEIPRGLDGSLCVSKGFQLFSGGFAGAQTQ